MKNSFMFNKYIASYDSVSLHYGLLIRLKFALNSSIVHRKVNFDYLWKWDKV